MKQNKTQNVRGNLTNITKRKYPPKTPKTNKTKQRKKRKARYRYFVFKYEKIYLDKSLIGITTHFSPIISQPCKDILYFDIKSSLKSFI